MVKPSYLILYRKVSFIIDTVSGITSKGAPSKPPADFISSVAQINIPALVWIAFSTWFNSLANTGLIRFHATASPCSC